MPLAACSSTLSMDMITASPILACGSMHFTAGQSALIYTFIGAWLASFILAFVNPLLILFMQASTRFRWINAAIFSAYAIAALTLLGDGFGGVTDSAIVFPIYGVPACAISHFCYLLWARRKPRIEKATPDHVPHPTRPVHSAPR